MPRWHFFPATEAPSLSIAVEGYDGQASSPVNNQTNFTGTHTPPAGTDAVLILIKSRNFTSSSTPTLTVTYDGATVSALVESYSFVGRGTDDFQTWAGVVMSPDIASNAWDITAASNITAPYVEFISLSGFAGHTPSIGGVWDYQGSNAGGSATDTLPLSLTLPFTGGLIVCQAGMSLSTATVSSFGGTGYTNRHAGLHGTGTTQQMYSTTRTKVGGTAGATESFNVVFSASDADIGGILFQLGYT